MEISTLKIADRTYLFFPDPDISDEEFATKLIEHYCKMRGLPNLSKLIHKDFVDYFKHELPKKAISLSALDEFFKRNFYNIIELINLKF